MHLQPLEEESVVTHTQVYLFSPFSPYLAKQPHHKSLVLLFFFQEILSAYQALSLQAPLASFVSHPKRHLPYAWAQEIGHINKAYEHIQLLLIGFEDLEKPLLLIQNKIVSTLLQFANKSHLEESEIRILKRRLRQIYLLAEPLIHLNKHNENLIFFLLKNQTSINALAGKGYLHTFLSSLYKQKLKSVEKKLCDQLHERGFFAQISEMKQAFARLRPRM